MGTLRLKGLVAGMVLRPYLHPFCYFSHKMVQKIPMMRSAHKSLPSVQKGDTKKTQQPTYICKDPPRSLPCFRKAFPDNKNEVTFDLVTDCDIFLFPTAKMGLSVLKSRRC